MAHNDKPESANEAQDHSQPLDDGGFFSLSDVIMAGRHQLTRSEQLLAADTRRNAHGERDDGDEYEQLSARE